MRAGINRALGPRTTRPNGVISALPLRKQLHQRLLPDVESGPNTITISDTRQIVDDRRSGRIRGNAHKYPFPIGKLIYICNHEI